MFATIEELSPSPELLIMVRCAADKTYKCLSFIISHLLSGNSFLPRSGPRHTVDSAVGALLLASSVVLILILTNDFKSEWMSLSEHNLGLLILKSNIRAILIIQMSENVPGTFIMDCFVLPGSHDTSNNVYHHTEAWGTETQSDTNISPAMAPSLVHTTKATDLLRTCVIVVFRASIIMPILSQLAPRDPRWLQRQNYQSSDE